MQVKKSGEAVRGSVLTAGVSSVALLPIFEPWVTKALNVVAWKAGVQLDPGYHDQFLIFLVTGILWLAAHIKVKNFEGKLLSFSTGETVQESEYVPVNQWPKPQP